MNTKGSAFLARQHLVVADIGQEQWQGFLSEFAAQHPHEIFAQPIEPTANIPVESFLALNDALVNRFYNGDPRAHWRFGEGSAEWAFSSGGPLRDFFKSRSFKRFIDITPKIWAAYYDAGTVHAAWYDKPGYADLRISDLPILHIHFEYNVMGYTRRALELTGGEIRLMRALRGIETGDPEIHYQFYVESRLDTQADTPQFGTASTSFDGEPET